MKRNIRQIPAEILNKLNNLNTNEIVVGCAVKFKASNILSGGLKHLGIALDANGLKVPPSILPPARQGKYSLYNIEGHLIKRTDLPKEPYFIRIDMPNWGNWSKGSHIVNIPHEKYQRDFRPPRELEISMKCNDKRPNLSVYIISFRVEEIILKSAKNFKMELFENLNLLQENIGACDVQPADTSIEEYAKSLFVSWEILPTGTRDEVINRLFRDRVPTNTERDVAGERYDFFMSLKPKNLVYGTSGFRRYFGAKIEDNLVVFENIKYGNAVYVLYDNWEDLSKKSRIALLAGKYGTDFDRVVHKKGWKEEVRNIVNKKRSPLIK